LSAEDCLDAARVAACDGVNFSAERINDHNLAELSILCEGIRESASVDLTTLDLIRSQDLRCLMELCESESASVLSKQFCNEAWEMFEVLRNAVVDDETRFELSDYFDHFPIPAQWRLAALEYPQGELEASFSRSALQLPPSSEAIWDSHASKPEAMPMMLADDEPGAPLHKWFERRDQTAQMPDGSSLTISIRLDEDWRALIDLHFEDGSNPDLQTVGLGGVMAESLKGNGSRWQIELSKLPPQMREKILDGKLIVETAEGALLRVKED
jgi:hypothetical protein